MSNTINLVLSPKIGDVSQNKILAGTEKIFFDDALFLSKYFHVTQFARFIKTGQNQIKINRYFNRFTKNIFVRKLSDFFFALHIFLKTKKDSVILSYSFPLIALFRPKKTIIIMESLAELDFYELFKNRYKKTLFLCCSNSLKRELINCYPDLYTGENIQVLYNAAPFNKNSLNKRAWKNRINLLFASAWVQEKGLLVLLQALYLLPTKYKRAFTLTIASNEQLWYKDNDTEHILYIKKIKKLVSLLPNAQLLGGIKNEHMLHLYKEYDITVFPSLWNEPFGLVVLESIFAGTPVLAFKKGGVNEILNENNSILLTQTKPTHLRNTFIVLAKLVQQNIYPFDQTNFLSKRNIRMIEKNRNTLLKSFVHKRFKKS